MAQMLFIITNIFAATVAVVAADLTMRNREPWRRMLATLAGFPIVILFIVLLVGSAGQLTASSTALVSGATACVTIWLQWRIRKYSPRPLAASKYPKDSLKDEHFVSLLSLAFVGGYGAAWVVLLGFTGTSFGGDDLSYHATAVAHWIVDECLSLTPLNYHAYYPFNAEVLSLWFMLPFRTDGLAGLSGLYWGALLVASGVALSAALGSTIATSLFVGALLLIPFVFLSAAQTFAATDLAGPVCVLASMAMAAPSRQKLSDSANYFDVGYAGCLAGFAVGCKVSFVPVIPVLMLWLMFSLRSDHDARTRLWRVTVFAIAALATGIYWYARNWLLTGNPIFPAAFAPFDGPFGPTEQNRTKLIYWILASSTDSSFWLSLVKSHIGRPVGLYLLAVVGYASAAWTAIRHRQSIEPNVSSVRSLLIIVGFVLLVLYPFMPFSGTHNAPHAPLSISLRYVMAPFAIGLILFGSLIRKTKRYRTLWICIAVLATTAPGELSGPIALVVLGAGSITMWVWERAPKMALPAHVMLYRPVILPVIITLVALLVPYRQQLTDLRINSTGAGERPVGLAWQALNDLPTGARVTQFGPSAYQYYPTFGRKLQLIPTVLSQDGTPYQPVHEQFRRKSYEWWPRLPNERNLTNLVPNLIGAGVEYVLVTKWGGNELPAEHEVLEDSGLARAIYDDGYSVIWKIGK